MAQAKEMSEIQFLNYLETRNGFPSFQIVKDSLSKLGYKKGLLSAFEAFQNEIDNQITERAAKLPPDIVGQEREEAVWSIAEKVRMSFRWQRFLSKGIFKQHAEQYKHAVAKSKLPFVSYEIARIADRKDPFARRIFLTALSENRMRLHLQDFRLSRAYFFGVFIRSGSNTDGSLRFYPCSLCNQQGVLCRHPCDPFGHHSFICKTTTKTADHNLARDILANMGLAFGFIAAKEVVVAPWFKKPDVELVDPSGELVTIYLDVTLPALHQEAITSREDVYQRARKAKADAYPRKDSCGRLLSESFCVPFILTSMGGLCQEGHDFLRLCKKRNKSATMRLLDVLVTQHAKWTARRIRRALFGQSLVDFSGPSWSCIKLRGSDPEPKIVNRRKQSVSNSRIVREFSEAGTGQRSSVPGMTQYDEVDIDAGNKRVSQESDEAFEISGSQESSSSPK